jgi:hypothetical protein
VPEQESFKLGWGGTTPGSRRSGLAFLGYRSWTLLGEEDSAATPRGAQGAAGSAGSAGGEGGGGARAHGRGGVPGDGAVDEGAGFESWLGGFSS